MPSDQTLLALLALVIVVLVLRRLGPEQGAWSPAWSHGPRAPLVAALLTAVLTTWIGGGLAPRPVWYDEAAYVLQAELLARGRFAAEALPVPEAFTQSAVLVTPVLTPKMPPGHALMLVPGVLIGLPGLIPVLFAALTAAMLVVLSRRVAGPAVAVFALVTWWTQAGQQRWRASYLSESTTGLLWLVAWWCLLRWREGHERRWLVALAAAIGLGAISRPLTMLLFAMPIGCVVLWDARRFHRWRDVVLAAAVGTVILLLLPLQNMATLGHWRASPLALYTNQYMPFDRPGFGRDATPPTLGLTAELDRAVEPLRALHAEHRPARLPAILLERMVPVYRSLFGGWRIVLIPAALAGLVVLPAAGWFAMLTTAMLYAGYLIYAHEPQWTAYYAEAMPVFALVVGLGLAAAAGMLTRRRPAPWPAAVGLGAVMLMPASVDFAWSRRFRQAAQEPFAALDQAVIDQRVTRGLIFVPPDATADAHLGLVRNVANLEGAPAVIVHDRGDDLNREVRAAFPDRTAYRYDATTATLHEMAVAP